MGRVYKHTQIGYVMFLIIGTGLYLLLNFFYLHGFIIAFVAVFVLLAVCLVLFAALRVEVDDGEISVRFGIGIIRVDEQSHFLERRWRGGFFLREEMDPSNIGEVHDLVAGFLDGFPQSRLEPGAYTIEIVEGIDEHRQLQR